MKNRIPALLAASIAALSTLPAHADTSIYGKLNVSAQSLQYDNEKGVKGATKENSEVLSNASRIGFKGDTRVNDDVKVIYKLEYEVAVDEGAFTSSNDVKDSGGTKIGSVNVNNEFKSRNLYVGLQGPWGTVIAGKHDTPTKLVKSEIDRFNTLQVSDIKYILVGENREADFVQYAIPEISGFSGLNAAIAVIPGEDSGAEGKTNQDNGVADKYSAGVTYKADNYYLGIGYDNNIQNTDIIRLAADYTLGDLTFGGLWQTAERHDDKDSSGADAYLGPLDGIIKYTGLKSFDKQDGYLVSATYTIAKDWVIKAQHISSTSKDVSKKSQDLDAESTTFGVDYKLAKATTVYAYTSRAIASADALNHDPEYNTFGIGLDHKF